MMDHFVVMYIPGGMSLNKSGWWVCLKDNDGDIIGWVKRLTVN